MSETSSSQTPTQPIFHSLLSIAIISFSLLPLTLFAFSLMGRHFFFAELLCNFRCHIMFLLLPFAVLLLLLRQWWLGLLFLLATSWSMIGIVWIYMPASQPPAGPEKLWIMSFNVYVNNLTPQLALDRMLEQDADIIIVVEYSDHFSDVLAGLNENYPHQVLEPRWHGFGIAIYSRYPLVDTTIHQLLPEELDCPMIETHVEFGRQKIRIVGLHVLSPTNSKRLQMRNRQLQTAAQILRKNLVPSVVMGDFNCTPWSPFLEDFVQSTGYRDSRQGFGYQATWHKDLGFLKIPIDHAFVSEEVRVHDRYVAQPAGSDHLPIVLEVSVAP